MRLRLSLRQALVLVYLACGFPIKAIARQLGITPRTVEYHLFCARERLCAATNEEAIYKACVLEILPVSFVITRENAEAVAAASAFSQLPINQVRFTL
ncbi:MAG: helix-turn-helix transcriptional regulator [Peptococcaceae bacterium]|nr:helix-turn-helix transcriptional regulator [Peptococcaceae bacterium]